MSKVFAFLKNPKVTHALALILGAAASSLASGHLDLSALLPLLGGK